jgi:hypothetical protein
MKAYLAGLNNSVQTSYANNGKTTMVGRAFQKTINGQSVIGPALTQFIDVQTIVGFMPSYSYYNPTTNHLFLLGPVSATPTIALYNFNNLTGVYSYVGKVIVSLGNAAATTYTWAGFTVYENGGLIYPLISGSGSVAVNGGTYVAWGLSTSDFTVGGTTIYAASGSGQKAVYFLQDPAALGVGHVATTPWGNCLPQFSSSSAVNTKVWQFNGTLAACVLYSWDLGLTPAVAGTITSGVSAQTTAYAGTSPNAYFIMGVSNNGYAGTNGEQVVLINGTGNVPTAFTAWSAGTNQTDGTNVYFVRDLQQISGSWYFNLATTAGGAAVTPTSSTSSFTMMRAFGISSSLFNIKTGTLATTFALGSILKVNTVGYCKPVSAPANTNLNGQDCLYMMTTTGLFMGKISDLTSLGTTWSSMIFAGIGITGTGTDIVTPSTVVGCYSGQNSSYDIDKFIYCTNTSSYVAKPYQSSIITAVFGGVTNTYYETLNPVTVQMGATAISSVNCMGGWFFACSSGVGQRGVVFGDIWSDNTFGNSGVISPVLSVQPGSSFKEIDTLEQLFDQTDSVAFWIRNGATSSDAAFSSGTLPVGFPSTSGVVSNGWICIKTTSDLSSITIGPYFQLCATYTIVSLLANTPAQLNDLKYVVVSPLDSSDNWAGSVDNTTQNGASPAYTAFRLETAYATSVPTMYFKSYDDSGNLVASANTASNPTSFQYTTNNGTSWNALGTIPNTIGTTELRYVWATPPGVRVTSSLRES